MRAAMREYNVELAREGLPPLGVGIGIHRGPGLAGLVGSRERMEYAFVGRTVNVAARVQALTRTHQVDILVTDALRAEFFTILSTKKKWRKRPEDGPKDAVWVESGLRCRVRYLEETSDGKLRAPVFAGLVR